MKKQSTYCAKNNRKIKNQILPIKIPEPTVQLIIFDVVEKAMVMKAAHFTKGRSGPSRLNRDI